MCCSLASRSSSIHGSIQMPNSLSFDDFKLVSLTCELRHKSTYFIFDRTGRVIEDLRQDLTNITAVAASPPQTTFIADEGTFVFEVGACRFTTIRKETTPEKFAKHCNSFFHAVTKRFEINHFTRIGLRYIGRKEYGTIEEAKSVLAAMALVGLKPTKRFNSSESPTEALFRWEDSQIGATVRLRAETNEIKFTPSAEQRDYLPILDKKVHSLLLDIDYYTVAAVERDQWNALEWLPQKLRIIRKEADGIIQN